MDLDDAVSGLSAAAATGSGIVNSKPGVKCTDTSDGGLGACLLAAL